VPQVTPDEVKKSIDAKDGTILLDVRTPGEVAKGKLEGSINIPLDRVACDIVMSTPDKNKKIFVYCLSGSRSVHAVDTMLKLGYTKVFNMTQGLLAWRVKGYPVVT
jgi:rhodanese-related sulfurtransferase